MQVSVVIPCLNEAPTLGDVLRRLRAVLAPYEHELIVADNGSTDSSRQVAESHGARWIDASAQKGAGAATLLGVQAAHGAQVLLLDADGEHAPEDAPKLLQALKNDPTALILGSRHLGGYAPGARGRLHRWLGTPALTFLLNHYFETRITDCNTGYRATGRATYLKLGVTSPGFEYCSEMIVRAALLRIPIHEVPITQEAAPAGRTPHLRRFRDGWRHLRFILLHAPDRVLLRPGVTLFVAGALLFLPQLGGRLELGPLVMDLHLMILGALFLFIGTEMLGSAIVCATIAGEPVAPAGRISRRLGRAFTLDKLLPWVALLFSAGFLADLAVVLISARQGWQGITEPRLALAGTAGMGLAVQLFVLSFVHSVVDSHRR